MSEQWLEVPERLGLKLESVIPTLLSGTLAHVSLKYLPLKASELGGFVQAVDGSIETSVIVVLMGYVFYQIYEKLFGEYALFPFQHWLQRFFDGNLLESDADSFSRKNTSPVWLMKIMKVEPENIGHLRIAYNCVKDDFRDGFDRTLSNNHSRLHFFYIFPIFGVANGFYAKDYTWWFAVSALVFAFGLIEDTRQHRREHRIFSANRDKVDELLRKNLHII